MTIATINPATGETIKTFDRLSSIQIDQKLERAVLTFRDYRHWPAANRREAMLRAAEILESEKESFGRTMVTEMGKPIKSAIDEALK